MSLWPQLRRSCLAGLLLLTMGCQAKPPAPRFVPRPVDESDLPTTPAEQVALADQLVAASPDDLDALQRARSALEQAQTARHAPFEVAWRLARVCFLMAKRLANRPQRIEVAQHGAEHARTAISQRNDRVEGHYYLALDLAQIAEAESRLSLIKPMVAAAERAAKINPAYDHGGPLVFLGKVHLTAPAWPVSVGNVEQAISLLERALALAPCPLTRLFLGQAYYEDDREQDARVQLERALREAGPKDLEPRWRAEAKRILDELKD